ncbi:MAG TPA: DUF3857 domain-containing protein [Pyrinomonadaceae bacterium]|nr:DUF3857 domain-containing protein [Pyrinomonadaceae bacterium]
MKFAPVLRLGLSLALAACFCLAALVAAPASTAFVADWKPIDPSHLAMKEPVVDKDADAEVIFWEVRVAHEDKGADLGTVLDHYVRIKIFTERGRESQSRIDIPSAKVGRREIKIKDIAGRTIKPDGSVVELKKEDVFERDIVKASGVKVKAKSFAMPGVEPGAIIEYRWREVRSGIVSHNRFDFSREIPVQFVKYNIKGAGTSLVDGEGRAVNLRAQTFHGQMTPFVKEKDGSYSTTMSNVPAFREEPRMPPEYAVRPWMLVYYGVDKKFTTDQFWKDYSKRIHEGTKSLMKVNDDVKKAAAEAVGDAASPEQKLERLFNYVRSNVKRVYDDASGLTPDQIKKLKENKSPADTLKRGIGTDVDIDTLFGALAAASGFEVRVACTSDRQDNFFDPEFADDYFINPSSIAVRVGDNWRFFNPASTYVPFGMLRWQEEGQPTLIADSKETTWVVSPISAPEKSLERRTAKLRLAEDGTLEGDVRVEYTGHFAADMKEYHDDESADSREEILKNRFQSRMGGVEVTDVKVENVTDPVKPFAYTLHIKVPSYAARTGKRLLFQPAFFQRGVGALFPTSTRRHHVYFHYPWAEEDKVEIELPAGFALDNAEAPTPISAGGLTKYHPRLMITKDGRTLTYERKFHFGAASEGGGNPLIFPPNVYAQLKTFFDELHKQDGHTLSIKQAAAAAAPTASN